MSQAYSKDRSLPTNTEASTELASTTSVEAGNNGNQTAVAALESASGVEESETTTLLGPATGEKDRTTGDDDDGDAAGELKAETQSTTPPNAPPTDTTSGSGGPPNGPNGPSSDTADTGGATNDQAAGEKKTEEGSEAKATSTGSGDKDVAAKGNGDVEVKEVGGTGEDEKAEDAEEDGKGEDAEQAEQEDAAGVGGPEVSGADGISTVEPAATVDVATPRSPVAIRLPTPKLTEEELQQFTEETGETPESQSAQVNLLLDGVTTEANNSTGAIQGAGEGHLASVNEAKANAESNVNAAVESGRGRVSEAFTGARGTLASTANEGIGAVDAAWTSGLDQLSNTAQTRRDEIQGVFDSTQQNVDTTRNQGAQAYLGHLQAGAGKLREVAGQVKAEATTEGDKKAKGYENAAKGKPDLESLHEESKAEVAKNVAASAGEAVDMKVKVRTHDLEGKAQTASDEAVKAETQPLADELTAKKQAADQNIGAGEETALSHLDSSRDNAVATLEAERDGVDAQADAEEDAAMGRLATAETVLRDDSAASADELANQVEAKVATSADEYAMLTERLAEQMASIEGPVRAEDLAPTIESVRQELLDRHSQHLDELQILVDTGIGEFEISVDGRIQTFNLAVDEQERAAESFQEEVRTTIQTTIDEFTGSIGGMVTSFNATLGEQVAPVAEAGKAVENGAINAINSFEQSAQLQFQNVEVELREVAKTELAKIDSIVEEQAQPITMSKRTNIVSNDIPAVFSAMDGMGTDEAGIFAVLRKMSWGQIEAFEHLWNSYKAHSIRWYFEDEMSGSDLQTGLAYLNHDRARALALELDASRGFWNDDEARIEEVMRSASAEEMQQLTDQYADTITATRDCLGGADRDVFNALADTSVSRDEASSKASAVRLHEAMDGMGTDEDAVKKILEEAKTPEERERLRKYFAEYSNAEGDWGDLDAALKDEMSGSDLYLSEALGKVERDDAEVAAAKVYAAGDGMGTDEKEIFDALKSDVGKWDEQKAALQAQLDSGAITDPDQITELQIRIAELDEKKSSHMKSLDSNMQKFSGQSMDDYLKSELSEGLELKIAMDSKNKGEPNRADLMEYASSGLGTDEELFKQALTDDEGNPLSKEEVAKLDAELNSRGLGSVSELAESELGGRDHHDVKKLELGKPETADDLKQLVDMDYEFETSGLGGFMMTVKGGLGISTAQEEMDFAKNQFDDKYSAMVESGTNDDKFDELAKADPELAQSIQEMAITSQKSSEAYGKSLEATVDGLITVLEIVGSIVATIATAGAASPTLALLIANIAIGTAGIVLKKAMVGDAYGYDQVAQDFLQMASTAVLGAALEKVKIIGEFSENLGKQGSKLMAEAGEKAGLRLSGKAWSMGPVAQEYLGTFIAKGTEKTITGAVEGVHEGLWNEENFDKGADDWLMGAATDWVGDVPKNFVAGGTMGMYEKYVGDTRDKNVTKNANDQGVDTEGVEMHDSTPKGSVGTEMLQAAQDAGVEHVVDHVTDTENYEDAGKFWEDLATGAPAAMLQAAIEKYGERQALPKNIARDLTLSADDESHMTHAQLNILATQLTADEKYNIGLELEKRFILVEDHPPVIRAEVEKRRAEEERKQREAERKSSPTPNYENYGSE